MIKSVTVALSESPDDETPVTVNEYVPVVNIDPSMVIVEVSGRLRTFPLVSSQRTPLDIHDHCTCILWAG